MRLKCCTINLMTQKEHFEIIYDGPALKSNEMDVRDLAPALLAISDVLEESNRIIYGDKTIVHVNVKGTFKTGSFGVDFSVFQGPLDGFTSLFNSDMSNAASNLLEFLGFIVPGGLIGLILWIKNRKIKKVTKKNENVTTIEVENEQKDVHPKIVALFSNVKVRTSIQKIISEPLSREGIDTFIVKKDKKSYNSKK